MRPANAIELMSPCPDCRGTGHSGNLEDELCSTCDGGKRAWTTPEALLGELRQIDQVLARRPALDPYPTRALKIEHAINVAANADIAAHEARVLSQDLADTRELLDAARAELHDLLGR